MKRIVAFFERVFYFFPVQLLFSNLKRNQVLLLCWTILFMMATGSFGKYLGIPYLFLDPEYMNRVNFTSFFIMGLVIAGFTVAFHITCYISDGHRFTFIGTVARPFTKFSINNSLIPAVFLITYVAEIIAFQRNNEYSSPRLVAMDVAGFLSGFLIMTLAFFTYFWFTNKDIFRYVVCRIDEKLKQKVQVTRASAMKKLDIARKRQIRVDYFLDGLKIKKVEDHNFYDRATIIQVFDQNHFNLVAVEVLIFAVVLILGVFKDNPVFQLPAAASFIIFLTIFVMLAGAFSYWFGGWSITTAIVIFLIINHLAGQDFFEKRYVAFGLNYEIPPAPYNIDRLVELNDTTTIKKDRDNAIDILNNWRNKFDSATKPKMVFIAASGGGKRAALWALTALQAADSITRGRLMENAVLITGASGGLIGATYFRELVFQKLQGEPVNPYAREHLWRLGTDNLNPLIFSLLANDLFVGFTKYEYGGQRYLRDRGYTFEEQLNQITGSLLDKPISAYAGPEQQGIIPMVIMAPTVVTDGRKLFISAQPAAFMNSDLLELDEYTNAKISGVDFQRLFENHGGEDLRFLSALRMCATFPYITPNTTLPTEPVIHIMDAGISDNFGLSDAVRFMFAFREWIAENTSGVVIVSIRDSPKRVDIQEKDAESIIDGVSQPISSVYNNFENFQDITNDNLISYANSWLDGPIDRIDLEYEAIAYASVFTELDSLRQHSARASLSWRLTTREKQGIMANIGTLSNQAELEKLRGLLSGEEKPVPAGEIGAVGSRQ
ncbi:MAG: patatin-like phospholipase family protein [Cyclobacteriaceae bacterium]|nr:patatin-like phospholipase family protein [Cyclobacteriaceae bacterium]